MSDCSYLWNLWSLSISYSIISALSYFKFSGLDETLLRVYVTIAVHNNKDAVDGATILNFISKHLLVNIITKFHWKIGLIYILEEFDFDYYLDFTELTSDTSIYPSRPFISSLFMIEI